MTAPCHHSGLPPEECDYTCRDCDFRYIPCPDLQEIRVACERIRARWPEFRLRQAEGKPPLEIVEVFRVSDGMVRREERMD